jgi:iron(II)-dependent oxidoreductase
MPAASLQESSLRTEVRGLLEEARARTLMLVSRLSDEDLHRQHDPLMSPIIWDIGHIAHFEELWLTRNLDGPIEFSEMPGLYNPFEHPRATRADLPIPSFAEMLHKLAEIRKRVLERLETIDFDRENPLLAGAYVYHMVLQHEYQHNETILQTLQLKLGEGYAAPRRPSHPSAGSSEGWSGMVVIPAGTYSIGTDDRAEAYDNERPLHQVRLKAFEIDMAPVTNAQYLDFMKDGGYKKREYWSDAGWKWLSDSCVTAPKHWTRDGDVWSTRTMDKSGPIESDHPV